MICVFGEISGSDMVVAKKDEDIQMIKVNSLAVAVALTIATVPVAAQDLNTALGKSNFSYSTLGIQLGKVTLDEEIVFLNEVYEDFGAAAINGSFQVADNFAIGAGASAFTNEGSRTEITNSSVNLDLYIPVPLGDRVDLIPRIGYVSSEIELCADGVCVKEDDSAMSYGLATRIWAVPGTLEIIGGFSDTNADGSESVIAIGAALWGGEHHRFALNYDTGDSFDAVLLGYSYNW